jgi:nucleoside-diphosphate-sugar epimerase
MVEIKNFSKFRSALQGKKVLVTGATGFVGGRLVERLIIEQGCEVKALIRSWKKATWLSRYPVELVLGDIRDADAVLDAMYECDIVFHCASGGGSDSEYHAVNQMGTRNVLEACRHHGIDRLVHISTIAVHGTQIPDGANENDIYRPGETGYADSKIAAEELVLEYHEKHKLPVTIIRPTYVWGPRSNLFTVSPLRQMVAASFFLIDEGRGDCHAVFIETLVDAIITASFQPSAEGRAFIVTDGYSLTWREFFDQYAVMLGKSGLPSLSSTSLIVRMRCRLYQSLRKRLESLKGNPAPIWRKVVRRLMKHFADYLVRFGVVSEKDLEKYARRGSIDDSTTRKLLEIDARYSFSEAMKLTELWVKDQMSCELDLQR